MEVNYEGRKYKVVYHPPTKTNPNKRETIYELGSTRTWRLYKTRGDISKGLRMAINKARDETEFYVPLIVEGYTGAGQYINTNNDHIVVKGKDIQKVLKEKREEINQNAKSLEYNLHYDIQEGGIIPVEVAISEGVMDMPELDHSTNWNMPPELKLSDKTKEHCVIDNIIDHFKKHKELGCKDTLWDAFSNIDKMLKRKKKLKCINPKDWKKELKRNMGLTPNHILELAKEYNFSFYVVEPFSKHVYYKYIAPDTKHRLKPLYICPYQNHMFCIEDPSIRQSIKQRCNGESTKMQIHQNAHTEQISKDTVFMDDVEKIVKALKDDNFKDNIVSETEKIEIEDVIKKIGWKDLVANGKIRFSALSGNPVSLSYHKKVVSFTDNYHRNLFLSDLVDHNLYSTSIAVGNHMFEKCPKSHYAPNHIQFIKGKGPHIICKEEYESKNVFQMDKTKAYATELVLNKFKFPLYQVYDEMEDYDGKDFKCGQYWIQTNNMYPLKGDGWYNYATLIRAKELRIKFKPKKQWLASGHVDSGWFKEKVLDAFRICKGDKEKEKAVNEMLRVAIGCLAKRESEKLVKTKLCCGIQAAHKYLSYLEDNNRENKRNFIQMLDGDESVYLVGQRVHELHNSNRIPIYNQIIESVWLTMYETWIRFHKPRIIALKTDCFVFPRRDVDKDLFYGKIKPPKKVDNGKTLAGLGGWKIEYKPFNRVFKPKVAKRLPIPALPKDKRHKLFPENVDRKLAKSIVEMDQGCLIISPPGYGKTTLGKLIKKRLEDRMDVVAPTNKAASIIGGKTIHKQFGLTINDDECKNKFNKNVKEYLWIDEISQVNNKVMGFIVNLKRENPKLKIIMTGDFHQCKAIDDFMIDPMTKKRSSVIRWLTDYNQIVLTEYYRGDTVMKEMLEQIKKGKIVDLSIIKKTQVKRIWRHITKSHAARKAVNRYVMENRSYTVKELGRVRKLDIPYKGPRHKCQDVSLAYGTPIIATISNKKNGIIKNGLYRVVRFTQKEFWICEMNEAHKDNKEINKFLVKNFHDYFWVAYATTIDSVQGDTIHEKICIWQYESMMDKYDRYSAVGRATKKDNLCRLLKFEEEALLKEWQCKEESIIKPNIKRAIKKRWKGWTKEYFGTTWSRFWDYLDELLIENGFALQDYGDVWNIDHNLACKPMKNNLAKLHHYTNLSPMKIPKNSSKGDRPIG